MRSSRFTRHCALFAGGLAIIALGTLAGCSKHASDEAPSSTTATTTPSGSPTEKGFGPGGNSFTPTVKPALPTGQAGQVSGQR
jgi:hypothetical protein